VRARSLAGWLAPQADPLRVYFPLLVTADGKRRRPLERVKQGQRQNGRPRGERVTSGKLDCRPFRCLSSFSRVRRRRRRRRRHVANDAERRLRERKGRKEGASPPSVPYPQSTLSRGEHDISGLAASASMACAQRGVARPLKSKERRRPMEEDGETMAIVNGSFGRGFSAGAGRAQAQAHLSGLVLAQPSLVYRSSLDAGQFRELLFPFATCCAYCLLKMSTSPCKGGIGENPLRPRAHGEHRGGVAGRTRFLATFASCWLYYHANFAGQFHRGASCAKWPDPHPSFGQNEAVKTRLAFG